MTIGNIYYEKKYDTACFPWIEEIIRNVEESGVDFVLCQKESKITSSHPMNGKYGHFVIFTCK